MDVNQQALSGCALDGIQVAELFARDEAELQRFFERAPDYFIAVNGFWPGSVDPGQVRCTREIEAYLALVEHDRPDTP